MEGLRMEIDRTRGKLHDMKHSYGWDDLINRMAVINHSRAPVLVGINPDTTNTMNI